MLASGVATPVHAQSRDIRAEIQRLGLTPDEVRTRLGASGLDAKVLDPYLTAGAQPKEAPSTDVQRALEVLARSSESERAAASRLSTRRSSAADSAETMLNGEPVFGLSVFRRVSTQFDPAYSGPVDQGYRLGAGDVLVAIASGGVTFSLSLEVTRDGAVLLPSAGQVFVGNLTVGEATTVLRDKLAKQYAALERGGRASLYVTVSRLRTNQIFVLGEVVSPGSYQVAAAGTVLTALYAAGGPTVLGTLRRVELRRGNRVIKQLDAYGYLTGGETDDTRLEQGDVIFVPRAPARALVLGEVPRHGWFELRDDETVASLLRVIGGLPTTAAQSRVLLERAVPPADRTPGAASTAQDVQRTDFPATRVHDLDRLIVFREDGPLRNRIVVAGHVWIPGGQSLATSVTLGAALRVAGGPRPDFMSDEVTIIRRGRDSVLQSLTARLNPASGAPLGDVALQEGDSVHVWARTAFVPRSSEKAPAQSGRTVSVAGAVHQPQLLPWAEGLTLRQAILRSGGLSEGASLAEAEVARMPRDRANGRTAEIVRVPLDSGFLFDRAPGDPYLGIPGPPARGQGQDFVLQPYDIVTVLQQPDFAFLGAVTLGGEVRFPGVYVLQSRGERMSSVVARAGGLTDLAFPEGTMFQRRVTRADSIARTRVLASMQASASLGVALPSSGSVGGASSTAMVTASYREAIASFLLLDNDTLDRINVDLPRAIRDRGTIEDLELRPGDYITVPRFAPTVTVKGFVNAPSTVARIPGKGVSYYVGRGGGASTTGDVRSAFVIQPNGAVESFRARWFVLPDHDPVPQPGSMVVVPPKDPARRPVDVPALTTGVLQVLTSAVTLLVLLRR
jgi:polysaccharide biosynthesis/export protein